MESLLLTIAHRFTGEYPRIRFVPLAPFIGRAYWHERFCIDIHEWIPLNILPFCIMHELAHIVLGHVSRCENSEEPAIDALDGIQRLELWIKEQPQTQALATEILQSLHDNEQAADSWATQALETFERETGISLLEALRPYYRTLPD